MGPQVTKSGRVCPQGKKIGLEIIAARSGGIFIQPIYLTDFIYLSLLVLKLKIPRLDSNPFLRIQIFIKIERLWSGFWAICGLWQYGLWSFQAGGTKLERFLHKNQHTQRNLLNFEFWINGELSKIGHHSSNKVI